MEAEMFDKILRECNELKASGASVEAIMSALRHMGTDRSWSIEALHALYGMPYREAARTIHESQTWQDTKDEHERFEAEFEEVLLQLAREHPGAIRFGPKSSP